MDPKARREAAQPPGRRRLGRGLASRAPALAAVLAAFAGVSASPAAGASVWRPPQGLSEGETNGSVPRVAIADDGSAVAVWVIHDPAPVNKDRVQFSTRRRGENFSVPPPNATPAQREATFLSDPDHNVLPYLRLKMNKRGDAIVVWQSTETFLGTDKTVIRSAYKPAGGDFGPAQVVRSASTQFDPSYVEPDVGIDGQGAATVIYHTPPGAFNDVKTPTPQSVFLSEDRPTGAGAVWGAEKALIGHPHGTDADPITYNETHGSLAVDEDASRRAVFVSQQFGPGGEKHQNVYEVSRNSATDNWAIAGPNPGPPRSPCCDDPEEDHSTHAVNEHGGTIAAWTHDNKLMAAYDSFRSDLNGPRVVNGSYAANTDTSGSAFAIDSNGDGLALWSTGQSLLANHTVDFGFQAPDPDPIAGNSGSTRTRPALATDANGSAIAVFQQKVGDNQTVQAAMRPPGGTTKFDGPVNVLHPDGTTSTGAPMAISEPGFDLEESTDPTVAMNGDGEGVAAWVRKNRNDLSLEVQVSLLVPQNNPAIPNPPPPPPRPQPAHPNPIEIARPVDRDQPVVLFANIPGAIDELRWSFGSKDEPPIVGKVVNGELQRTIRLRLPTDIFTATVTAVGPDGTRTFSRALATPNPSSSQASQDVRAGLKRTDPPPVFAVGAKDTLTGQSNHCSESSIFSGQQKISGCFKPIENLVDIPSPERGAIHELATQLGVDETKTELMQKATQLTDSYVAQGRALLNDQFPVIPGQGADVLSLPQAKSLISAKATLPVGSATYDPKHGFNLKLDPKKAVIPLGRFANPPKLPSLGGLEIVGDWHVDLQKQEATVKASLKLPQEITNGGVRFDNEIDLRATPDRVIVDKARVGPIDVDIGALKVRQFQISYDRAADQWDGQALACAVVAACLDMVPPDGHITIRQGRVTFAGASVTFPPPGIELFPGIDLTKVGFGVGFDPTRLTGSALISAVRLIGIDGRMVLAFPNAATPFILRRDEVGNDFAPGLYGQSFTRPTFGIAGGESIRLPETDESLEFAHGYFLYEYPGYVALGGAGHLDLIGIIQLDGSLSAAMDIPRELVNLHGDVQACAFESSDICGSAVANISHGPNRAGGAGACIALGPLSVGGGVQWARLDEPFIWPLDGCKWSRFAIDVRPSTAHSAKAHGAYSMPVRPGAPSPVLKLFGRGGAPRLRVRGPGGQLLDGASAKQLELSPGGKIRIMRFEGNKFAGPFTVVGLQNAQPGNYTVEQLPGSPPISGSAHATDLPDAKVSGQVIGKGRKRVLRYRLRSRTGQKVSFQELEPGGPARAIGTTTRGGRGQIRFDSAPGRGVRQVIAQFELSGIPAERRLVATFKPQSAVLAKPTQVRVQRSRRGLVVSWRRARGARRYEVAAALSTGPMVFTSTGASRVTLPLVAPWDAGRVTVRAIDDLRQGPPAGSPAFRATAIEPSPFRPLLQCDIGATIACGAPPALRHARRRHHRQHRPPRHPRHHTG